MIQALNALLRPKHSCREVTRGAREEQFPGRRKVPTIPQELSSIPYICFRKTSGSTMGFILLRLNPLSQRKLPIVISLSRILCFGQVCASPCALNVSTALQSAYITPFPAEVVRAIRAQQDEAYVSKIVCYLHVMASNQHPPPWRAPHLHHFYFTSPCNGF